MLLLSALLRHLVLYLICVRCNEITFRLVGRRIVYSVRDNKPPPAQWCRWGETERRNRSQTGWGEVVGHMTFISRALHSEDHVITYINYQSFNNLIFKKQYSLSLIGKSLNRLAHVKRFTWFLFRSNGTHWPTFWNIWYQQKRNIKLMIVSF